MKRYTDKELENFLTDLESDLNDRKESFKGDVPKKARQAVCAFAADVLSKDKRSYEERLSSCRMIASPDDPTPLVNAKEFADKYELPKFYGSYDDLLLDKEVDVVYISLPNHLNDFREISDKRLFHSQECSVS